MGWFDPIVDAAEDVGNGIVDGAEAVGGAIVDGAEAAWDAATGAAEDAGQAVGNGFSSMVDALGQAMEDAMQAAAKAAEDAAKAAAEAAEDAAKAMEQAVNDTYDWGRGAADTLATGVADAADWGIGAFETVGSGIAEGLRSIPEEVSDSVSTWVHENLSKYAEEAATTFASGIIAGIVGSGEETTDKPVADGQAPNAPLGPYTGEDESVGTVGQGLSIVEGDSDVFPNLPDGGVFDALRDAIEGLVGGKQPDLSDATPTVDEALVQTSASSAALADADTKDQSSSVGALLGADGGLGGLSLGDTAQPLGGLRDASDAGIIVVGGHEGPGAAFTDANPLLEGLSRIAGASFGAKPIVSAVGDISNEHRELARETLDGVELPNTSLRELADRELFNERPFELPGLDGPFGGRDLLGWLDGKGGYGGPNGLGGIPGGLGGDGGPGGFEGLPGWLGGRGGPGDLGGFPGGFGGPSGDGAPIGEGGFGGELGGFGGLPGWLTGDGNGGLDGLFGVGLGDRGSAGGFGGIDPGGAGGIDGLGIGLPPDLGGSRMPDIKLKGEDAMWHEEGNKVVADKGETLQVERGTKSFTVSEGKSFEKHEGDQFVSNKEPNTHYYVSDGKVEKVGGSNSGGTTNDKPHPGDPKGMPADGDSGGGPNWSPYAMPADDGSGGGPNWSPYAMPADDGSGGGPVWSTLMPADDSVGGGGPSWSLHDSSAVAVLADTQPATSGHQFASAFSAIEPHFSLDGVSALGSHMWF